MEPKNPIIIDGVNVAECEYHSSTPSSELCYMKGNKCRDNKNCNYKQHKRKEQECEDLRKTITNLEDIRDKFSVKLDQLKAENKIYKQMLDNPEVQVALTDIQTGERDLWQKYKPRMEQAEQKLERIREIANNYDNCNDVGHYVQDTEARHALEEVAQAMCDIPQIIDEVE